MNKLSKIFTEPLFHFLLIGASLFLIFNELNKSELIQDDKEIHITKAQIQTLSTNFVNAKGREATKQEKKELLDNFIQEEVLYHEALEKGLDKNDKTIRLHLVKKMKYVFDDLGFIKSPSQEELKEYFSKNTSKFMQSASISFNQVVFTKTSKDTKRQAEEFLKRLQNKSSKKVSDIGNKVELSQKDIIKNFGKEFSKKIFSLPEHRWLGPIKTRHGFHLVYIHSNTQASLADFSKIKNSVVNEWRKAKQLKINQKFYENLYKDYTIAIDKDTSK